MKARTTRITGTHNRDGLTPVLRMDNLLTLELRRPFLQKGARAFGLVLGGAAYGEQRGLEKQPVGQRQIEAAVHRLHGVLDGQRRVEIGRASRRERVLLS